MLSRNELKKIWIPTMIRVAAKMARRSSESAPKPRPIHWTTITAAITMPTSATPPPSARPCSSRKRARMRSNHGSCSPMKYMP